jgi:hypothetical protein
VPAGSDGAAVRGRAFRAAATWCSLSSAARSSASPSDRRWRALPGRARAGLETRGGTRVW